MSIRNQCAIVAERIWNQRIWHHAAICDRLVCLCLIILFVPILPWCGPDRLAIGDIDGIHARRERERAGIYAVLESQDMRLNRASVRNLARSIQEESEKRRFDPALVLAIIKVESHFDHRAVSRQGARGLMQIQPVAALVVQREMDFASDKILQTLDDPIANVKIGTAYLRHLKDLFNDLRLALIAYNWGPTKLRQTLAAKSTVSFSYANKVLLAQRALERSWEYAHSLPAGGADHFSEVG